MMPVQTLQALPVRQSAETWFLEYPLAGPLIRATHHGQRRVFEKGEHLYRQGEVDSRFYFLLSGRVQVSVMSSEGNEFILEIMGRWAVCGEAAAFDKGPRFSAACALETVEAIEFDANNLTEAFRQDPEFAVALLRIASIKQRVVAVRVERLASQAPEGRLAELLRRLADLYGEEGPSGTRIKIRLTHEQIASMTGTSRVTVTRTLKRWRKEEIIAIDGGSITLRDLKRLVN